MDKTIQKKKWTLQKLVLYIGIPLVLVGLIGMMYKSAGTSRLKVPKERLTISEVSYGPFQEFIAINGEVLPLSIVQVTAIEGGQVKEIYLEGGELVKKGAIVMKLTNPGLELNYMNLQTNMLEQADQLRNTKINLQTNGLLLKDQLVQLDYQLRDLKQQYDRNKRLFEDSVISEQDFLTLENNYIQIQKRKDLMITRIIQDSILRTQQLDQVDNSLGLVARNLNAIQQSLANLTVKVPTNGQLSSVRVEIGETVNQGQKIADVDELKGYKVRARIDEHYHSRVERGLKGEFTYSGKKYKLVVRKKYPEITNGVFEVDMEFDGEEPEGIKQGLNLQIRLALSEETQAFLLPRGGFYQSTGGNWVYIVNQSGTTAYKKDIRIGRQSDRFYEVMSGLKEGDKVITSNYDVFNDVDELVLTE